MNGKTEPSQVTLTVHRDIKPQNCFKDSILWRMVFVCDVIWENLSHVAKGEIAKERKLTT